MSHLWLNLKFCLPCKIWLPVCLFYSYYLGLPPPLDFFFPSWWLLKAKPKMVAPNLCLVYSFAGSYCSLYIVFTTFNVLFCLHFSSLVSVACKQTIAEQLGLPEPPKRPLTPHIRFMKHSLDLNKRKFPRLSTQGMFFVYVFVFVTEIHLSLSWFRGISWAVFYLLNNSTHVFFGNRTSYVIISPFLFILLDTLDYFSPISVLSWSFPPE